MVDYSEPSPELVSAASSYDDTFADNAFPDATAFPNDKSNAQTFLAPYHLTYKLPDTFSEPCDTSALHDTIPVSNEDDSSVENPFDLNEFTSECFFQPDNENTSAGHASEENALLQTSRTPIPLAHGNSGLTAPDGVSLDATPTDDDEEVEEIQRQQSLEALINSPSSISASSVPSERSLPISHLNLDQDESGVLHHLFHTETCGILSIKNGERENPWKTMLWPLMFEERALYFAMLSMTASHAASHLPHLRMKGLELMTKSMEYLRTDLPLMRSDAALATTLVLAFSESWHTHIYTGIMHLRGARNLITQGLREQNRKNSKDDDTARLRFLRNTWIYMDVIARLTALGGEDSGDLDSIVVPPCGPDTPVQDIDPLMGCATTLFPLIGAVTNLVKKVRKTRKTSLQDVTRAASLRDQILKWSVPQRFHRPKDKTLEIDHSRHTAEAYKLAIILYLYQAVPVICTHAPAELAEWTLSHLAAVPMSSSATIIHIFPLLAAGCEAMSAEDREFVKERWEAMMGRMCIGNLDRCWDVVKEVWERRDDWIAARRRSISPSPPSPLSDLSNDVGNNDARSVVKSKTGKRSFPRTSLLLNEEGVKRDRVITTPTVTIEPEMTVKGPLHWVAVMEEKKWESKSSFLFPP